MSASTSQSPNASLLLSQLAEDVNVDSEWLREQAGRILDRVLPLLYFRLLRSSSAVPHGRVQVLCELLEGEKKQTKRLLRDDMNGLVDWLFLKLTKKVMKRNADSVGGRSVDDGDDNGDDKDEGRGGDNGGDRGLVEQPLAQTANRNQMHQPSTSSTLKPVSHQSDSNSHEPEHVPEILPGLRNVAAHSINQQQQEDGNFESQIREEEDEETNNELERIHLHNADTSLTNVSTTSKEQQRRRPQLLLEDEGEERNFNREEQFEDKDRGEDESQSGENAPIDATPSPLTGSQLPRPFKRIIRNVLVEEEEEDSMEEGDDFDDDDQLDEDFQFESEDEEYDEEEDEEEMEVVEIGSDDTDDDNCDCSDCFVIDDDDEEDAGESTSRSSRPSTSSNTKQSSLVLTRFLLCPQGCEETFSESKLKEHLRRTHQILAFRCLVKRCGKSFSNNRFLREHLAESHQHIIQWNCGQCHRHFSDYKKLSTHNTQYHKIGQFDCSFPGCRFTGEYRRKVFNHSKAHRNARKQANLPSVTSSGRKRQLQSQPSTSKKPKTSSTVGAANNKHVCKYEGCGKSFFRDDDLARHERIHLSIKPYSCTWSNCGYSSVNRSGIIQHIRIRHFKLPHSQSVQKRFNIVDNRDPYDYFQVDEQLEQRRLE